MEGTCDVMSGIEKVPIAPYTTGYCCLLVCNPVGVGLQMCESLEVAENHLQFDNGSTLNQGMHSPVLTFLEILAQYRA